jgi:hypothetical protein
MLTMLLLPCCAMLPVNDEGTPTCSRSTSACAALRRCAQLLRSLQLQLGIGQTHSCCDVPGCAVLCEMKEDH